MLVATACRLVIGIATRRWHRKDPVLAFLMKKGIIMSKASSKVGTPQLGSNGLSGLLTSTIKQVLGLIWQTGICGKANTYLRTRLTINFFFADHMTF